MENNAVKWTTQLIINIKMDKQIMVCFSTMRYYRALRSNFHNTRGISDKMLSTKEAKQKTIHTMWSYMLSTQELIALELVSRGERVSKRKW